MRTLGFDQPVHREHDEFDRGFLADQVYQTLMSPGSDWAVRVALNGDWGCGKTSIAEMIEARARTEQHPVGWLHPWKMNASDDVALALMSSVLTALEEVGMELSAKQSTQKIAGPLQKYLKQFKGLHAFADVGLNMLKNSLAFDAAFAQPIAETLAQRRKRLLVIIDDLDRCDPAFLPPLLLFMRTAFDVPGFSFLAPFDSDIVAKAIRASNPAWTNADRFLEKVFDFRIPIPDLTTEQKKLFLISRLAREQIFVSDADVQAASVLLPSTPRAIKALARDIGHSRAEIERRQASELSWSALLLATMLRATSLEFYRAYLRDVLDPSDAETFARGSSEDREQEVKALWDLVGHIDEATRRRVEALVSAIERTARQVGFDRVRRAMHFMDEHEPVTVKEFEDLVARWRDTGFNAAFSLGTPLAGLPERVHAAAIVTHAVTGFQHAIEGIADRRAPLTRRERTIEAERGAQYLALAANLLDKMDGDRRFDLFSRMIVLDRQASATEEQVLTSSSQHLLERLTATSVTGHRDWLRYDEAITGGVPLRHEGKHVERGVAVSEALRVPLKPFARGELVRRFEQAAGIEGVFDERAGAAQIGLMARLFLDPDDEIWSDQDSSLRPVLARAAADEIIRENARAALHEILYQVSPASNEVSHWQLMAMHMESQPPYSVYWCVCRFVRSVIPLSALWAAYTAVDLSGNARHEARLTRQKLLLLGAREEALPGYVSDGPRDS